MKSRRQFVRNGLANLALLLGTALLVWLLSPRSIVNLGAYLVGGEVWTDTRIITGGALDEPSLHKGLFLFLVSVVVAACTAAVARWALVSPTRSERVIFRLLSTPLFLLPLALITTTFAHLVRYIGAMGFTERRTAGLIVISGGYLVLWLMTQLTWSFRHRQTTPIHL